MLAWLCQAGITEERALAHLRDGWVLIDGTVVTDPDTALQPSERVELRNHTPHAPYD